MAISTVRQSLMIRFLPENIGFEAITREDLIERHVAPFANRLYNPSPEESTAITCIDCTHLNIEKSTCFKALRQSFCVHKSKHLVKPPMITGFDAYILGIQGPYFSNAANNDGRVLLNKFHRDVNGMRNWSRQRNICALDRGYQEILHVLHLKSIFKFFANRSPTSHISDLSDFLRICRGIINKYYGPIPMPNVNENLVHRMLNEAQEVNVVQTRVEQKNMRRERARWV